MKHELIEDHYRLNYNRLIKRTVWRVPHKSQALAEECVQEAYARAMSYFNTFNPERSDFNKWFEGILRNSINDCRTMEQDRGVSTETLQEEDQPLTPSRHERIVALYILKDMKEGSKKQILSLFLLYGFKTKEISEITGIKHNTVRGTIARWRNRD